MMIEIELKRRDGRTMGFVSVEQDVRIVKWGGMRFAGVADGPSGIYFETDTFYTSQALRQTPARPIVDLPVLK